jgi:hypothetical protein
MVAGFYRWYTCQSMAAVSFLDNNGVAETMVIWGAVKIARLLVISVHFEREGTQKRPCSAATLSSRDQFSMPKLAAATWRGLHNFYRGSSLRNRRAVPWSLPPSGLGASGITAYPVVNWTAFASRFYQPRFPTKGRAFHTEFPTFYPQWHLSRYPSRVLNTVHYAVGDSPPPASKSLTPGRVNFEQVRARSIHHWWSCTDAHKRCA